MNASTPKLSEVARHVVYPDTIVETAWPRVVAKCAHLGVTFDAWQHGVGTLALGLDKAGKYAATIGGVVLAIPRQVGKTFLVGMIVIALCLLNPGMTVLWTAHHTRTTTKTFSSLKAMTGKRKIRAFMLAPRNTNGEQEIRFRNGSVIMFGAREQGFGRGFDEVDIEVFDEAQILTAKALEDMVAAANQSKQATGALLFFMGTPPRPTDPGEEFTNRRKKAIAGTSSNMVYVEFSADRDAKSDDRKQYAKANPSFPLRTPLESILRMRENLTNEDSFRREALGIWDDDAADPPLIRASWWFDTRLPADADFPGEGVPSYAVRFAVDGSWVGLAGALRFADDDPIFVEIIESQSMIYGIDWLTDWIVDRQEKLSMLVIDGRSDMKALYLALRKRGFPAEAINFGKEQFVAATAADAYSTMVNAVRSGDVWHDSDPGQQILDDSVAGSKKRKIGPHGGFGFEPRRPGVDSSVEIEAVALARYAAAVSKRVPSADRSGGYSIVMT